MRRLNLRLDKDLYLLLKKQSNKRKIAMNTLVILALEKYLKD